MTSNIMSLRVSRRALAAAVINDEELTFHDGHHLSSRVERAVAATERYVTRLCEQTTPTLVVIDAPHAEGSTTSRLVDTAQAVLAQLNVRCEVISIADVLSSFGVPGLRSRRELGRVIEPFWPALSKMRLKTKAYVADAAALALYSEVRAGIGLPAP